MYNTYIHTYIRMYTYIHNYIHTYYTYIQVRIYIYRYIHIYKGEGVPYVDRTKALMHLARAQAHILESLCPSIFTMERHYKADS